MFQIFQSPRKSAQKVRSKAAETSRSSSCPSHHNSEARQSLARVTEIQKFAKVLPHCSSPVRLNHLARCRPLQARPGHTESFETLYHKVSNMAVINSNRLPLPTNNYPEIPRNTRHKKSSSKRPSRGTNKSAAAPPAILVSHPPAGPVTEGKMKTKTHKTHHVERGKHLLNLGDSKNYSAPTTTFNFVS